MAFVGVVMVAVGGEPAGGDWTAGPLKLPLPFGGETDRAARGSYTDRRAARILYGDRDDADRSHRQVEADVGDGLSLVGLELLEAPDIGDTAGILTLHLSGDTADVASLHAAWSGLLRWKAGGAGRDRVADLIASVLGTGIRLGTHGRPLYHSCFLSEVPPDTEAPYPDSGMTATEQWLFAFASAVPLDGYGPHEAQRASLMRHLLPLSRDWTALVLRDGAAFLGHAPDSGFLASAAPIYVRSIYADVFMLGVLQRLALGELTDQLAALDDPGRHSRQIEQLDIRFSRFRNGMWWQHLTQHGIGNELLVAFQEQANLPALMEQTTSELEDYSRQANLRSDRVLNAILSLFAVIGVVGVAVEGYALYRPGSAPGVVPTLGVVILAVLVGVLTVLYALGVISRRGR